MKEITQVISTTKILPIITAGRTGRRLGMFQVGKSCFKDKRSRCKFHLYLQSAAIKTKKERLSMIQIINNNY